MTRRTLAFAAAAATILASTGAARAQTPTAAGRGGAAAAPPSTTVVSTADYTEQQVDGGQVVTFPGDELPADLGGPYGDMIRRPPGVLRVGLVRPRLNFVSELLKSVENL